MDLSLLDAEELFQLSLNAIERQDHAQAITLLKHGLSQTPEDGRLHYLLGAEYAQIGMSERAAQQLETALLYDASLLTARFQLGLLYLTAGQAGPAIEALTPLIEPLEDGAPLRLFAEGLLCLLDDQLEECKRKLAQGIAANQAVPVLNHDMQKIIDRINEQTNISSSEPANETPASASNGNAMFIRAYANNPDDKAD
ncbi:hypothetical protein HZU77_014975 [Neisseriaceae bacterium TC5R-5]|nr:hypothetical protein [Neisseriaceae bacterium TC5R-5]